MRRGLASVPSRVRRQAALTDVTGIDPLDYGGDVYMVSGGRMGRRAASRERQTLRPHRSVLSLEGREEVFQRRAANWALNF
jgi:hypothetical protein